MQLSVRFIPMTLKLKEAFTISRGSYSERKAVVVALSMDGITGFGEASEHAYYQVSQEKLLKRGFEIKPVLENLEWETPEKLWHALFPYLSDIPFLQCAIDNAAHDLYGKILGIPCYKLWGLQPEIIPKTSYTLSIDTPEKMLQKLQQTHFDIYKVKLGTGNDLEIMQLLCSNSKALFRVDANCAWDALQTIAYSKVLQEYNVEFIEQPLKADDWDGMELVKAGSALPVMADEACVVQSDVIRCAPYFQGIVIKLMKCGGLTPALKMIQEAKHLGLKVMCGCMVESSVGISAIGHLLPLLDYVDMDGALLLAEDPASGVFVHPDGSVEIPEKPGLGIETNVIW